MGEQNYSEPIRQLMTLGRPDGDDIHFDLARFGITSEHSEELQRLVVDPVFNQGDPDDPSVFAPLYAWRALGQLRAESAIETLIHLVDLNATYDDDWVPSELPKVFAQIGPASLHPLAAYASQQSKSPWTRATAIDAIAEIGKEHPSAHAECVAFMSHQLQVQLDISNEDYDEDDEIVTTELMSNLVDLRALEAVPLLEAAFAAERIDLSLRGDWEAVQIELGLLQERQTPALHFLLLAEERRKQRLEKKVAILEKELRRRTTQIARNEEKQQLARKKAKRKQEAKSRKQNQKKKR